MTLKVLRQEWWLDTSALPCLLWARFDFFGDHHVQVFDLNGQYHHFRSEKEAKDWLHDDEYEELQGLIRAGEVPLDLEPPSAPSDELLVPKMSHGKPGAVLRPAAPRRRGLKVPLLLAAIFGAIVVVAVKNSQTCQDRPGGFRRLGMRPVINESIIPCEKECCRPDPWACKCTGRCPCIPILRSKQR